ncbi:MAG: pantoate--beta-alanine ligase [Desulfovibrionaceae bacterium]|nr:pantoate--beta-alanine ligase [Desulfovibrionaceae bacterium]
MEIIKDPCLFQRQCLGWRLQGLATALVPTMGFFHHGHLSLMDFARQNADRVAVSLFVNPTQFGPAEDLAAYPRDLDRDARLAAEHGADILFTPGPEAMYAPGHCTWIEVPDLARGLCGRTRPGHFRGVATVVAKLFMLALPGLAVFGEKDWQQLAIIRRMAKDLNMPVEVVGRPTVREPDGLAMSSRNAYLSPGQRLRAAAIHRGLVDLAVRAAGGETDPAVLLGGLRRYYAENLAEADIEYLEIVDPETLEPLDLIRGPALAAAALRLGPARLIDNISIGV